MTKLNQIIAVSNGQKTRSEKELTAVYQKIQKTDLFNGVNRTYYPTDEEGERFPAEKKLVQYTVEHAVEDMKKAISPLMDVVFQQDVANCAAKADVVVDGQIIINSVPVTHLLFLEKKLTDIHTFVTKLPTVDSAQEWEYSDAAECLQSKPTRTHKSKKVPKAFVKYEATKEHPAQVDMFTEDVKVGEWETINMSGAIKQSEKTSMLEKVDKLLKAVKMAREEANSIEVENVKIADKVLNYLF